MLHLIQLLTPIAKCLLNWYTHWYSWGIKRLVYPINTFDCSFTITWAMKNQKKIHKDIIIDFLSLKYSINLRHSSYRIESNQLRRWKHSFAMCSCLQADLLIRLTTTMCYSLRIQIDFANCTKLNGFFMYFTHNFHQP